MGLAKPILVSKARLSFCEEVVDEEDGIGKMLQYAIVCYRMLWYEWYAKDAAAYNTYLTLLYSLD